MESLAETLAGKIAKTLNLPEEERAVLAYSLKFVMSSLLAFTAIIIGGLLFGVLAQALAAAVTISFWRTYSGGAHCHSPRNCVLLGALITTSIGLLAKHLNYSVSTGFAILLPILFFAAWSAWRYAPADSPAKPLTNPVKKARLRRKTFIFLALWVVLSIIILVFWQGQQRLSLWVSSVLGLLWQAFSLTPQGYQFTEVFDRVLGTQVSERR